MSDALILLGCVLLCMAGVAFWLWQEVRSAQMYHDLREEMRRKGYFKPPPKHSEK